MKFELWRLDQHPSRMDRDIDHAFTAADLADAEEVARKSITADGYKIIEADSSHGDYCIFFCEEEYAFELRRVEQ